MLGERPRRETRYSPTLDVRAKAHTQEAPAARAASCSDAWAFAPPQNSCTPQQIGRSPHEIFVQE